jgi:hypothetical protein
MSSNITAFPIKRDGASAQQKLDLPGPRIWKPTHLAEFLGVSVHWVYKRTEASADDPIPRVPGVGRLAFDTQHPDFQAWMRRQLGYVDNGNANA